jgi:hypothetical protein
VTTTTFVRASLSGLRTFFRSCLRLRQAASDAADVMTFRPRAVTAPPCASDTWYAACGVFFVGCVLALRVYRIPILVGALVAMGALALFRHWASASTDESRRAYLVMAAGGWVQLLSAVFHPLEMVFAAWFVLAYFVAMNRSEGSHD